MAKLFNLQEALAGKPVVTRDGSKVVQIVHLAKVPTPQNCIVYVTEYGGPAFTSETGCSAKPTAPICTGFC